MAEPTSHPRPVSGTFCWNELTTTDSQSCTNFYTRLFGWMPSTSDIGGVPYTTFKSGEREVGGMFQMTDEWGDPRPPAHWMTYVAVDDVEEVVRRVAELGGKVCVPPTDIPNVGRFSVITDPSGATLSVIKMSGM